MIIIAVFGLFSGAALAQRFRVLALVPGTLLAILLVIVFELTNGCYLAEAFLASGVAVCALQVGYLLGLCVKGLTTGPKTARMRNAWLS